jgi:long-chain acyl-CoA synthetase
LDEDGFVWIEGRSGDLINRGGNKVFPDEVEEVLRLSPLVAEAAVVGAPDDRLGEVPVAFIVTTGDVGTTSSSHCAGPT